LSQIEVKVLLTNESGQWLWVVQNLETKELLKEFITYPEVEKYCNDNGYEIKLFGKNTKNGKCKNKIY